MTIAYEPTSGKYVYDRHSVVIDAATAPEALFTEEGIVVFTIPAGSWIGRWRFSIPEGWDGSSPVVDVGTANDPDRWVNADGLDTADTVDADGVAAQGDSSETIEGLTTTPIAVRARIYDSGEDPGVSPESTAGRFVFTMFVD